MGFTPEEFTVKTALLAGITPERLRSTDLHRPFHGVRARHDPGTDLVAVCRALFCRMPDNAVFSHVTAARLLGIPVSRHEVSQKIHVAVPLPQRAPHANRLQGHSLRLGPDDLHTLSGIPVTSPARTWRDLATILGPAELVAAGDFLLSRRCPHPASPDKIRDVLTRSKGARGTRKAWDLLDLLDPRAESPQESKCRYHLVRSGLKPEVNLEVFGPGNRFVARVDLAFRHHRVAVEYEGDHHRTDQRQWRRDIDRVEKLAELGWRVVRLTANDLDRPEGMVSRVKRALDSRRPLVD